MPVTNSNSICTNPAKDSSRNEGEDKTNAITITSTLGAIPLCSVLFRFNLFLVSLLSIAEKKQRMGKFVAKIEQMF